MKRKRPIKLIISVLVIAALIVVPLIARQAKMRNEVRPFVESWAEKNNISIKSFSVKSINTGFSKGTYSITVVCDGFKDLTSSRMSDVVRRWEGGKKYDLEYIISSGTKYSVDTHSGSVYDYFKRTAVAFGTSHSYSGYSSSSSGSSSSSSSSSSKTAICNYCHGTGKVDGKTCPWCGGSGKTYDNFFNDALG